MSSFLRGAVEAPAAPEEISVVAEDTEVGARSRGAYDFLSRLEEKVRWCDTSVRDSFVQEAVRGHRLEFCARPPMSLPRKPPVQKLRGEKMRLKSVSGKEKTRWSQTGDQSQRAELLHKQEDVQDVHHQRRLSEYPQRRLGLHNRLERPLPPCAHSKRSQKVPTFLVGRKELPVPSPPFQTKHCAQNFHKINPANCDAVSGKRNRIACLLRRLPRAGTQQAGVVQTY